MKFPRFAFGVMLLSAWTVGPAWGQSVTHRPVALDYDYGYHLAGEQPAPAAKSPSDVPLPAAPGSTTCDYGCAPACCEHCGGRGCGCGCRGSWLSGFTWGGWLQVGMTGNAEDPHDRYNGPMLTNDRVGDLQMNQLWFYTERVADTRGHGFDVGGRVDFLYGTDWRVADCFGNGLEDRINSPNSLYGFSVPQFYAEFAVNELSIKVGRQVGALGYEGVPPTSNFFYSHNYMLCYVEPIIVTGVMAKYPLSDEWSVVGGIHNGTHSFENQNGDMNFQGGVVWTSPGGVASISYMLDAGRNDEFALQDQYIHTIVFKRKIGRRTEYVLQSDYSFTNGNGLLNGHGVDDAEAYGIAQYLFYQINAKWKAGMRVEWFRDDDGTAVCGIGNLPDARGWRGVPGYVGNFTELTFGLNWKPRSNVLVRPEIRWDWYDGPANPHGPAPYPFDDGHKDHQFTFATDVVLTF